VQNQPPAPPAGFPRGAHQDGGAAGVETGDPADRSAEADSLSQSSAHGGRRWLGDPSLLREMVLPGNEEAGIGSEISPFSDTVQTRASTIVTRVVRFARAASIGGHGASKGTATSIGGVSMAHSVPCCRGDDLWGMPQAELTNGWCPRSLHGLKTRRPASPGGPAAPTAGWRFHRGRPEPDDEDKNPPTAVSPKVGWPRQERQGPGTGVTSATIKSNQSTTKDPSPR
jgi:hypothetical protein